MKRVFTSMGATVVIAAAAMIPLAGASAVAPANDDFAAAQALVGTSGTVWNVSTDEATKEPGEPAHAGKAGGASVWYTGTPSQDGVVRVSAFSYEVPLLLAVYTGDSVDALTEVGSAVARSSDGFVDWEAELDLYVVGGTTYRIAVDGYGGSTGFFDLWFSWIPYAENDDFANALTIEGLTGSVTGGGAATLEPGEPTHGPGPVWGGPLLASVWYRWTAPATRYVRFDTGYYFGAVYTGTEVDALTPVAQSQYQTRHGNYGYGPQGLSFRAQTGTTYSIAIAMDSTVLSSDLTWYPGKFLIGTRKADVLRGTPGADFIDGRRGNDVIYGFGGNDTLIGWYGGDRLYGGPGNDWLKSRDFRRGNDAIYGGTGSDTARADRGDLIRGVP